MKLKGFTLAEVLITVALLGVVASMTLPALSTNMQKQQAGSALMRAISTLDNANALMLVEHDIVSFGDTCVGGTAGTTNYVANCFIGRHVMDKIGAGSVTDENVSYKQFNSADSEAVPSTYYMTKNGFTYAFDSTVVDGKSIVYIDVNGPNKRPNELGKDLFVAYMYSDDGKVYAAGSQSDPLSNTNSSYSTWNNEHSCDATSVAGTGLECAGSIIDNSGRVVYSW